ENVEITAAGNGEPGSTHTSKDGRASLSVRLPGAYLISASRDSYTPLSKEVNLTPEASPQNEFVLSPIAPNKQSVTVEGQTEKGSSYADHCHGQPDEGPLRTPRHSARRAAGDSGRRPHG